MWELVSFQALKLFAGWKLPTSQAPCVAETLVMANLHCSWVWDHVEGAPLGGSTPM